MASAPFKLKVNFLQEFKDNRMIAVGLVEDCFYPHLGANSPPHSVLGNAFMS